VSLVTNVIFTIHCGELRRKTFINHVQAFFSVDDSPPLADVTDSAAGTKRMEMGVLLGAYNYFKLPEFLAHVASFRYPRDFDNDWIRASTRVFVREQDDENGFHEVPIPWIA